MFWLYQGQEVLDVPEDTYGFIYRYHRSPIVACATIITEISWDIIEI